MEEFKGAQGPADPIAELLITYNELNSGVIAEFDEEPSPLEFMRYVSKNTPFVVRRAAAGWEACRSWNAQYLRDQLGQATVNVAVTPKGWVWIVRGYKGADLADLRYQQRRLSYEVRRRRQPRLC
jgi:hypothetical protein